MMIFHYHPNTSELLGFSTAEKDPLDGEWLIPAHATKLVPPAPQEGKMRVFDGEVWVHADIPEPQPEPQSEQPPFNGSLPDYVNAVAWQIRRDGSRFSGHWIKLDGDAIGMINGMTLLAMREPTRTFNFQTEDGFISLTSEEAIDLAVTIANWVQQTFDRREQVLAAVGEGIVTTAEQVLAAFEDVTTPWVTT